MNVEEYNSTIFRYHFSDILALIVCVPLFANVQVLFKTRKIYCITLKEIIIYFIIFSIAYEFISPMIYTKATGDWLDVFSYALGGLVLWLIQYLKMKKCKKYY
jgi:hypothetical protein